MAKDLKRKLLKKLEKKKLKKQLNKNELDENGVFVTKKEDSFDLIVLSDLSMSESNGSIIVD